MTNAPEIAPLVSTGQRRSRRTPESSFPSHPGPDGTRDDPDLRREWDTDAAAARARAEFVARATAEGQSLAYRERNAVLYQNDDGGVSVGNIGEGEPMTGRAPPYDFEGVAGVRFVGLIHVHPGSNIPSAADWYGYERYGKWIADCGGNPDVLRLYIIGSPHPLSPITVFSLAEREVDVEVNPDGAPC